MAVKLRLTRTGTTNRPCFRIIAVDSRARRDGPHLEILGHYDPLAAQNALAIREEAALKWLNNGAQPSETVRSLLKKTGIWQKYQAQAVERKRAKAGTAQPAPESGA